MSRNVPPIEALVSARLFLAPQLWEGRIYFISNMSGRFSLYTMDYRGSVPEPLLPPDIALQNPELMNGYSFHVSPKLGVILVGIDKDGDEKYQPMFIPIDGGFPELAFPDVPEIVDARVGFAPSKDDETIVYVLASAMTEQVNRSFRANLATRKVVKLGESKWGGWVAGANRDNTKIILMDGYTVGDDVLYKWEEGFAEGERRLLHGIPLEQREEGQEVKPNALGATYFTPSGRGLLTTTGLFEDTYGVGYLDLQNPAELKPVKVTGTKHTGLGEMEGLEHLHDDWYRVQYNIDGATWSYEGRFDERELTLSLDTVLCGQGELSNGVMEAIHYDDGSDRYVLSFSTASSPTQIYSIEKDRSQVVMHTRERILGVPESLLSEGEDASFTSHDGLRISARLYLPSDELGFQGPRPIAYYIHGGPQSQERPNFAWFSMPLIQFLTLNGFAVFVPNVRGSSGYGLSYMKQVDRDWGGKDRLDHVYAMTEVLPKDPRLDTSRTGVLGRSYGGYMTLTLAARHPELWSAAVDMFGPYNLLTFIDRLPETWKPYFAIAVGDPEKDRDFLLERSPYTYINDIRCPLLVIQGANDPRVIERESRDVAENLQEIGKHVEYLVFENEGHDVIKFENKVRCYNAITDFFKEHLRP